MWQPLLFIKEKNRAALQEKYPIESTDAMGNTILLVAAINGHYDLVQFLIASGAAKNHKNRVGHNAIDLINKKFEKKPSSMPRKYRNLIDYWTSMHCS